MPFYLDKTTKAIVRHSPAALPQAASEYIKLTGKPQVAPELDAVRGQPTKYWTISGDTVSLVDQATRDAIDAAEEVARRDAVAGQLDQQEDVLRAFMLAVLDELNAHAAKHNEVLDAMDAATSLGDLKTRVGAIQDYPARTAQQLRTAVRNKLGM